MRHGQAPISEQTLDQLLKDEPLRPARQCRGGR
jgi:hypothetical protein